MTPKQKEQLRALPAVGDLLTAQGVQRWLETASRPAVVRAIQDTVDGVRRRILAGNCDHPVDTDTLLLMAEDLLWERMAPLVRRVINATGVVLHTGLGRAPLCDAAIDAITDAAAGYCTLEYDLETGRRGQRVKPIGELIRDLTGAEAATVVNNNAAATLLVLSTFAAGREVVVSRGQLVEIGGSYRLPEIMVAAGAVLHEVGTTNRTYLSDYERAINDRTAILMRVHTSNFRMIGFTEEARLDEIVGLAQRAGLLAVDDLGSGALFDVTRIGLPAEPCVPDSLKAGADLICFSGDKLLGGPQAGIILGRSELIERVRANPLARCCRVDKLTLLALEATLRHYEDVAEARASVPALAMLSETTDALADRARALCEQLQKAVPGETFHVCSDASLAGGGSLPARELPTVVVQWRPGHRSIDAMMTALRHTEVPVIARVREDGICFDLRTIRDDEYEDLAAAVASATATDGGDAVVRAMPS
ncbi:MAG: L-seryl-tRNA(Sec) selenium transferase [Phycisphaerales bacterium]|nr:MAG: L-seryl-tRNA(Sec) selenium transferase [Phycisphaerales bacterium]